MYPAKHHVLTSFTQKCRAIFIDLSIGIGIPVVQLVMGKWLPWHIPVRSDIATRLEYIVSGHRFDIYEGIGCYPFIYNTPVAYPLSVVWPLIIGLISAVYCGTMVTNRTTTVAHVGPSVISAAVRNPACRVQQVPHV